MMLSELRDAIHRMLKAGMTLKEIEVDDKTYDRLSFEFSRYTQGHTKPVPDNFREFAQMEILGVSIIRSGLRNPSVLPRVHITNPSDLTPEA